MRKFVAYTEPSDWIFYTGKWTPMQARKLLNATNSTYYHVGGERSRFVYVVPDRNHKKGVWHLLSAAFGYYPKKRRKALYKEFMQPTVHGLKHGLPLCHYIFLPPIFWPKLHTWVSPDQTKDITCGLCRRRAKRLAAHKR